MKSPKATQPRGHRHGIRGRLRIVIVTYNWPPRNAIGTHRPYSWAKAWLDCDASIVVLTAQKQSFDQPLDLNLPLLPGVDVREIAPPRLRSLFAKTLRPRWIRNLLKRFKRRLASLGSQLDVRAFWKDCAAPYCKALAREVDVVVSTFGPAAAHQIAFEMKKSNPKIFWVADYRDAWSGNRSVDNEAIRLNQLRDERETVGAEADLVTTVSDELADSLAGILQKRVRVFPNGFDHSPDQILQNFASASRRPRQLLQIVYTGKIYDEHQSALPLLHAIGQLTDRGVLSRGQVKIDFYGSQLGHVERLGRDARYRDLIKLRGHVPRDAALQIQSRADLLLLLESEDPHSKGILSGKLFEYIAAGRPILCVGSSDGSAIDRVLTETGTGLRFSNLTDVEDLLMGLLRGQDPEWYSPKPEAINKYSRDVIAKKFMDTIREEMNLRDA